MNAIWQWIVAHQTTVTMTAYFFFSNFVGSLDMPDANSSKLYSFFFRFANRLAANWTRAGSPPAAPKLTFPGIKP